MWLLVLGGIAACTAGVTAYAVRQVGRPPVGHPASVIADGEPPAETPVLVCLGDSITHGGLGADWVGGLRHRLGDGALVVNAGANGEVVWSVRQRLDEVARCRPAAIVLMVGTNDAVGTLGERWAAYYENSQKLPQAPDENWFAQQYDALVGELAGMTPGLVCLTLPPLGEQPESSAYAVVQRYNEVIRASAARHGADVLDAHATLRERLTRAGVAHGPAFVGSLPKFLAWMIGSAIGHYVVGWSWDRVATRRDLVLTSDTIHPSDRAGAAIVDLVEPWARTALWADEDHRGDTTL